MVDEDFLASLAGEAADVSTTPTDEGVARLRRLGMTVVETAEEIDFLKKSLSDANKKLWDLQHKDMPDLMAELGVDKIGLPEAGADIVLGTYAHANISADWPEEQRDAAFAHLEEHEAGDLIKNTITIIFPRGSDERMKEWLDRVRGLNFDFDPPEMVVAKAVPWNTLTAWVKEMLGRGVEGLDLKMIGAEVGMITNIKKRK